MKKTSIIKFLHAQHDKKAWYIDIRQELAISKQIFDSESDFDNHLNQLIKEDEIIMDSTTMVFLKRWFR